MPLDTEDKRSVIVKLLHTGGQCYIAGWLTRWAIPKGTIKGLPTGAEIESFTIFYREMAASSIIIGIPIVLALRFLFSKEFAPILNSSNMKKRNAQPKLGTAPTQPNPFPHAPLHLPAKPTLAPLARVG